MRKILGAFVIALISSVALLGQVPGRNVNMISGTTLPEGDPFLQRQNEGTIASSTRNPEHLLAGGNDYRTVDLPGLPDDIENGDAWLGVYRSIDGGLTWKTTLLPGYPQDTTPQGLASPIHGFQAAADPTVRAGTHGLFYYSGIAFNRGASAPGAVFVARFQDLNNKENGNPIAYLGTKVVAKENNKKFLDKPWIAVDMPRGDSKCSIDGSKKVDAGVVYLVYSMFNNSDGTAAAEEDEGTLEDDEEEDDDAQGAQPAGPKPTKAQEFKGRIMFTRSTDCGVSWSPPQEISEGGDINQGATIAIDPANGAVYVAWRRFADTNPVTPNAIYVAKSKDGKTFDKPQQAAQMSPFDQKTTRTSFRTNSYPAMAVDDKSRAYIAWASRGVASLRPSPIDGDSRIVIATSTDGKHWSAPRAVDDASDIPGHQLMPALAFAAGKLQLAYYDLRKDVALVFAPSITDSGLRTRHTIDVRSAQADPGATPIFTVYTVTPARPSAEVSDYPMGSRPGSQNIEQMQFNPPNFPLFKQGTAAFFGDYIDVAAAPPFVPTARGGWAFNTAKTNSTIFHVVWTDNRDVRPPADNNWANYTPPFYSGPTLSGVTTAASCTPGQTGMRNQNIYTARVTPPLVAGSPGNAKPLSTGLQRGFVVYAQNTTNGFKSYRLTIANQPPGGRASFSQFPLPPYTSLSPPPVIVADVRVPPRSMAARTVYITSTDPRARVDVSVAEITTPGGPIVVNGDAAAVALNPDITNPDITNPDFTNPDITNPDITNAEAENPDITNAGVANPDFTNPDITNPDITNPDFTNVNVANPDITNPDFTNPDITNPDITNPDFTNPDITNPDITNGSLTDVTWRITNNGNTAAVYSTNLLLASAGVPTGFKLQLVVYKTYTTPVAVECDLKTVTQNQLLLNIINPQTTSAASSVARGQVRMGIGAAALAGPDDATFWLAPGETARITLRVVDPNRSDNITFDAAAVVFPVVRPEAVNSVQAAQGVTQPPAALPPSGTLLTFATQPSDALVNQRMLPAVQVRATNLVGSPVPGKTIALALNPSGPAALHGTLTAKTNTFGIATFSDLRVDTPGTFTVVADALGAGIPTLASTSFRIGGAAAQVCATPTFASLPVGSPAGPGSLAVADFDGDGFRDVAVGSGSSVIVFQQIAGTFAQAASIALGNTVVSLAAADLNGDGRPDLVVATSGGNTLRVIANTPGGFVTGPTVVTGGLAKAIAIGDVNEDGALDVLVATTAANQLQLALGHGDGTLANAVVIPMAVPPSDIVIGDYTGDGLLDVAAVLTSGNVAILTGNGAGGFAPTATVALAGGFHIAQGDFNEDGALDLAVLGSANNVHGLLGAGNGQFAVSATRASGAGAAFLAIGDFNGDAHIDVATAAAGGVSILAGDAAGQLGAPPAALLLGAAPLAFASADINGDGSADLLAGLNSNQVVALLNGCGAVPTITPQISGTAGSGGWYRSNVDVSWLVTDPSGIALSNGCGPTNLTAETAGVLLTCSATNNLGGSSQVSVTIKIDKTPPTVSGPFVNPPPNLAGWNNTVPVDVLATGNDTGAVQSDNVTCTSQTLTVNTAGQLVSLQCSDLAGNTTPVPAVTVKIDTTPPAIVFGQSNPPPPPSGPFTRDVIIPYSVTDPLSGLVSVTTLPVYVTAIDSNRVVRVDAATGVPVDVYVGGNNFEPLGVAISPTNGKLYVTDDRSNRILRMDQSGLNVEVVHDSGEPAPAGSMSRPVGVVFAPNGDLFTNASGPDNGVWRIPGGNPGTPPVRLFALPTANGSGLALAFAPNGDLFAGDPAGNQVVKSVSPYSSASTFVPSASLPACSILDDDGLPFCLLGMAVSAAGDLYIAYKPTLVAPGQILRFDSTGAPLGTFASFTDFVALMQFDFAGNLWANMFNFETGANSTVWRISPGGVATPVSTTVLGPIGIAIPSIVPNGTVFGTVAFTATSAGAAVNATDVAGNAGLATSPAVTIDKSLASFVVTNTSDGGDGSLRQAILNANAHAGVDTITFNIQPPGAKTITPLTDLPQITGPTVLNATTQPGFAGSPVIELSGVMGGPNGTGLRVVAGGSTIRGFAINRWGNAGIEIHDVGNNTVAGNYIGTNLAGTAAAGNGNGIVVSSPNNVIGGTTAADRNIVSGNTFGGIQLNPDVDDNLVVTSTAAGTVVTGNYIGTNAAGTAAIANAGSGVGVNAPNITIGGTAAGAGNVISGNNTGVGAFPFVINNTVLSQGSALVVQGNRIGTNAAGTGAIANSSGVFIAASGAHIGGAAATARNIISGNSGNGISLSNSFGNFTFGNNAIVDNNYIGTNAAGTGALANSTGVFVQTSNNLIGGAGGGNVIAGNATNGLQFTAGNGAAASNNQIRNNFIGVNAAGTGALANGSNGISMNRSGTGVLNNTVIDGNTISGNTQGGVTVNNIGLLTVTGNFIGTNATGTAAIANTGTGISITNISNGVIGGATPQARNVISGNGNNGVSISGTNALTANANSVLGNYIGTDVTGGVAVPNASNGILLTASTGGTVTNTIIGGPAAGAGNVLSGNTAYGISLGNSAVSGTIVQGNVVGTNAAAAAAIANGLSAININASSGNTIGGTGAGEGNVLSGNGTATTGGNGVFVQGGATSNIVQGNHIGTNAAGTAAIPNKSSGVSINNSNSNTIGGVAGARNVISGNGNFGVNGTGISISGTSTGNTVAGNYIGTNDGGTGALPNTGSGVSINAASNIVGPGNVVSGNATGGVFISGASNGSNVVKGNFIGTNALGTAAVANVGNGLFIGSNANTIGGTAAGDGNVISGNSFIGLNIGSASSNVVQGNRIGTDVSGTLAIPNQSGVILNNASNNTIGGITPQTRNIISGNTGGSGGVGIGSSPGNSSNANAILGNYIGTDASGTTLLGNAGTGIFLFLFAGPGGTVTNTTIGGTTAGSGNVIAGNNRGITADTGTTGSAIRGNAIFSNTGLGIDLASNGIVNPNDAGDADTGANNLQNFPVLTQASIASGSITIDGSLNSIAGATFDLDVFASASCDASGSGEGAVFLGTSPVTTDGTGNIVFNKVFTFPAGAGAIITATATDAAGNTSEFAQCVTAGGFVASADLSIGKTHGPTTPVIAQPLTYTLTVTNGGPSTAAAVTVTDTLPASVSFVSANASQGSCNESAGTVTCNLGAVANAGTASVTIVVTPSVAQPITNNASVSSSTADSNGGNNTAQDIAIVGAFGPCTAATLDGPTSVAIGAAAPGFIATGDVNKDGFPDVVVNGGADPDSVTVMLGSASGTLGSPVSYNVGGATRWPVVADLDGDTNLDIAVDLATNAVAILRGDGTGNFTPIASSGTNGISGLPFFLGAANLNADSKPDLVVGSTNAGAAVTILLNQSTPGTFTFTATTIAQGAGITSLTLADYDFDGDIDLAPGKGGVNTLTLLLNNGAGAFTTTATVPASGTFQANVTRVRDIGDLNGDGRVDLGVKLTDGSFQVVFRNAAGGFLAPGQVTPPDAAFAAFDAGFEASSDFNGDGFMDLARVNFATDSQQEVVEILLGDGTGTQFTLSTRLPVRLTDKFAIADLNQDGRPDLVVTRTDVPGVLVFLNTCATGSPGSAADLEVQMTGPPAVNNGSQFSYTVTVTNHGPSIATNVKVTDIVPFQGLSLLGASPTQGNCGVLGGTLECAIGNLSSGGSVIVTVDVQAVVSGTRTNFAFASSGVPDGDQSNNSASFSTTVAAGPATMVVTTAADNLGDGSFRQALRNNAANTGFTNTITFNIPGAGAHTITPLSGLPTITNPVVIDGTTQPGFAGSPLIEVNGANAGAVSGLSISAGGSTIRSLVINRFANTGISIFTGGGNVLEGNFIGTDLSGAIARANGLRGINITSGSNVVGPGNLISGNTSQGILMSGAGATLNVVKGNRIGTNAAVTAALGNGGDGVLIFQGASTNTVGGTAAGDGNVISGNQFGLSIGGATTTGNVVSGNFIGTNATGTAALGNVNQGINLNTSTTNNTVGGTTAAAANVISGNSNGILVLTGATNNVIRGNFIGTNAAGTAAIANTSNGIFIDAASANTIGGTAAGAGNTIAFSGFAGVTVASGSFNTIRGNAIHSNGSIGIDLAGDGVTANDAGDGDAGANNLQNFPALTQAVISAGSITVDGSLNSTANSNFTVEFFANASCDASGSGEGALFLGSAPVTTNGSGNITFSQAFAFPAGAGSFITATATDAAGNTSEFSACVTVGSGGGPQTFTVVNTNDSGAGSIRQAILDANANAGADTIAFNIPGSGVHAIAPASPLPTITDSVMVDGTTQSGFSTAPVIELNGTNAGGGANGLVLASTAPNSTIRSLAINRFGTGGSGAGGDGIVSHANAAVIKGNFIGVDAFGTAALPNRGNGVVVDGANQNVIGTVNGTESNVISGNGGHGIVLNGANAATLGANYIGTDAGGVIALGNGGDGVLVSASTLTQIGFFFSPNVIAGNGRYGVNLTAGAIGSVIESNIIGAGVTFGALGNLAGGMSVADLSNTIANNTIAFNSGNGVSVNAGSGNRVEGNTIFSNLGIGIDLAPLAGPFSTVLDFEDQADSLPLQSPFPASYQGITWNNWYQYAPFPVNGYNAHGVNAIYAAVDSASFTFTDRVFVGARFSSSATFPNPGDVFFELYYQGAPVATSAVLSGTIPTLTFLASGYSGLVDEVRVRSVAGAMTPAGANWIMDDLVFANGATPNDAGDVDAGANDLQNFPVLTSALNAGGVTTVSGTLHSTPDTVFGMAFFSNPACDPSGFGQGTTPRHTASVLTDNNGDVGFAIPLPSALALGDCVTATATDDVAGNTSEFSTGVAVAEATDLALSQTDSPDPIAAGNPVTYTLTVTNTGLVTATNVVLTDTLPAGVAFNSVTPNGSCNVASGVVTCALGSIANGANAIVTIVVTPPVETLLTNSASVTADQADPVGANNSSIAQTLVTAFGGSNVPAPAVISFFNPAPPPPPAGATLFAGAPTISFFNPAVVPPPTGTALYAGSAPVTIFNPAAVPPTTGSVLFGGSPAVSLYNPTESPANGPVFAGVGAASVANGPSLLSVAPAQVQRLSGGQRTLTVTGNSLSTVTTATLSPSADIAIDSVTAAPDGLSVTIVITLSPSVATGLVDVVVQGSAGTSLVTPLTRFEIVP